jgi:hypothetical protein
MYTESSPQAVDGSFWHIPLKPVAASDVYDKVICGSDFFKKFCVVL